MQYRQNAAPSIVINENVSLRTRASGTWGPRAAFRRRPLPTMRRWNRRVKPGTRSTALLESTTIGWHFILTEWMKSYPPCEFLIFSSRAERLTLGYCCCFRSALDAFTHTNRQQAQNMLSMAISLQIQVRPFSGKAWGSEREPGSYSGGTGSHSCCAAGEV